SGNRVRASRSRRSAIAASGTSSVKGRGRSAMGAPSKVSAICHAFERSVTDRYRVDAKLGRMRGLSQIAKYAAAGIAGLRLWTLAARVFIEQTVNAPEVRAEGEVYKMEREAQRAEPGKPIAVAMGNYAIGKASEELAATANPAERRYKAAQIFI